MGTRTENIDPSFKLTLMFSTILTALCILIYLFHPAFLGYLHFKLTDTIVAGASKFPVSDGVVIVDIDEKAMTTHGQWPWPRTTLASLLDEISRMGARSIALDFILAEPDRTAPNNLQGALHNATKIPVNGRNKASMLMTHDAILAATLGKGPFVLGYEFLFNDAINPNETCHLHALGLVRVHQSVHDQEISGLYHAKDAVCNLSQFADAVSFSGFLNGKLDSDGLLRRLPIVIRYGESLYPNLALAALLSTTHDPTLILRQKNGTQAYLITNNTTIPIDRNGNVRLGFLAKGGKLRHVSADSILKGEAPQAAFKDRIVFVGLRAAGLMAMYQTPANGLMSAVEIHAQLAETIISKNFIRRPPSAIYGEVILAIVMAVFYCIFITRLEFIPTVLIGTVGIVGLWEATTFIFHSWQLLFCPLLPTATIMVNGFFLVLFKYWTRQKAARHKMHEALILMKSSESNLNSIIKTIPDIVFRLDIRGQITFISSAVAKYQEQPEKLVGTPILDLVNPEDKETATYRINERRTGKRATSDLEIRLRLSPADGENIEKERYFSVSAEGIYSGENTSIGGFLGTQGIARDIHKRKLLENKLEQSKKMEAVGNLAAGVAHDLNNILSVLVSYPELLLLDLPSDSPLREKIKTIQTSGQRAAAIVQDMLTIARRGVKTYDILNLNETINAYLKTPECQIKLDRHPNIKLKTDLAGDLMNTKGSTVHLSKIIMNLVANATEAMPTGGSISIITQNRYLDKPKEAYETIPEGEYVYLSIRDEGIGIAMDDLARIFEPFYSKKKMGRSGSGLGMTVVWSAVKDHSGYVDIESREGEGTRFDIYFPATRDDLGKIEGRVVLQDYLGTERILVVDDIEEQRAIAVQMLSKLGYRVVSALNGEEAISYIQTHSVDLLVLDMVMPPGIDGLETFKRIRQTNPGQKAIIASGYAESKRVSRMQKMGAGAYIQKPYTLEKIGVAVRKELDRLPD